MGPKGKWLPKNINQNKHARTHVRGKSLWHVLGCLNASQKRAQRHNRRGARVQGVLGEAADCEPHAGEGNICWSFPLVKKGPNWQRFLGHPVQTEIISRSLPPEGSPT